MKKWLLWAGGLVLALALALLLFPGTLLNSYRAIRSGSIELPGLSSPVTVKYDAFAVPHVYAENVQDLFYATGYLMASERMFQMDMVNRAAQGRLSELNARLMASDRYLRTWGFYAIAERMLAATDPESLQYLQWSCDGINAWIEEHDGRLPIEFRLAGIKPLPWTPQTVAAYARLLAHELQSAYLAEVVQSLAAGKLGSSLMAGLPPEEASGLPARDRNHPRQALEYFFAIGREVREVLGTTSGTIGSNNWVVSGSRTESGLPLLANDPHLGFTQPGKWMEMHLVGGPFNVRGLFLPGVPMAILGNNAHIAWGVTNLMTDDIDFFVEEVNPDDPGQYRHKGSWRNFINREETLRPKGGDPVNFTVRKTVHGVIISDLHPLLKESNQPVAMRWSGQDVSDILRAFTQVNLAENWDQFSDALQTFGVPGQNFVYADRQGNIGWRPVVHLPIRKEADRLLLRDGASGEWDWQGYVPFAEMPYLYNPPEGFIATANNNTVGENFAPYVSRYWADPSRINRIRELLQAREKHSPASLAEIQTDILSDFARQITPYLVGAFSTMSPADKLAAEAVSLLDRWDFTMRADAPEPAIFQAWVIALAKGVFNDELAAIKPSLPEAYLNASYIVRRNLRRLMDEADSPWFDNRNTEVREDRDTIIRQTLYAALAALKQDLGNNLAHWEWGRLHTLTHPHDLSGDEKFGGFLNWWLELDVGPFPAAGAATTVNALANSMLSPYAISSGPSFRTIIDLSDLDNSRIILPAGQSGNSLDPHYRDQAALYNRGEYRPVAFSPEAVDRATVSTLILRP